MTAIGPGTSTPFTLHVRENIYSVPGKRHSAVICVVLLTIRTDSDDPTVLVAAGLM